jgi:ABC-type lipoprotein release transport system permease subunit
LLCAQKEIHHFIRIISGVAIFLGVTFLIIALVCNSSGDGDGGGVERC